MDYSAHHQFTKQSLLAAINGQNGFVLFDLQDIELQILRQMMFEQYLHVLQMQCPQKVSLFRESTPAKYHSIYTPSDFDHADAWRKHSRVLGPAAVNSVMQLPLYKSLRTTFGDTLISDEEKFGWPGIYWRLVRPGASDIGPMHADSWFWELGHGDMPDNYFRLKIWIALWAENGKSGLQVVPGSHRKQWRFHAQKKGNMLKPVIAEDLSHENVTPLPLNPGQAVIFHDDLLHGGMPNESEQTRVSMEFTLLVPEEH